MAKKIVVTICEFIRVNNLNYTFQSILLVPKHFMNLSKDEFSQELHKLTVPKRTILVAYKFGVANVKSSLFLKEFKPITGIRVTDTSDWFLQPMFCNFERRTLDKRVDPMILFLGEEKDLKFRIYYYLDLLEQGYDEEEAMRTIL